MATVPEQFKQLLPMILRNVDNPKYTFAIAGTEKIGDVNATILEINADGSTVKWFIDPATGKQLWVNAEARCQYGTPAALQQNKTDLIVTPAGDVFNAAVTAVIEAVDLMVRPTHHYAEAFFAGVDALP